ncbi:hypothetical protein phytr_6390 [Candidatus Phycorickettsia trachydisci]|uniref:Uncharacterized protein n=1 Tax=Candidatus Phycorickettsia trachydisci TaxID=2115978 RepID=A0A2P1P8H4_9RICK|nr:hypothetical protein [Candidatus Phycorickettsia trachydisci]AVP87580.1 hypothetical protein phytr_6390 [Candidatus Phycorickettsia trachydisci]
MIRKIIVYLIFILLHLNGISFAYDQKNAGVREIDYNLAKATLENITTHLEYAEQVVMNDILPYVNSKLYTQQGTGVYAYLVNNTGNTSTFTNWITTVTNTNSGSYTKNPYIYKLAIVNYGLKIQMQFVNNYITPVSNYSTSKLSIFEPFLGRRIILVPHIKSAGCGSVRGILSLFSDIFDKFKGDDDDDNDNDDYDDDDCRNKRRHKRQKIVTGGDIDYWTCYTDADETVAYSANGIPEGSVSIVSIAGGVLNGCMFMRAANLNNLWVNI